MYAKYETCDPFSAGFTKKIDQVLPYFVMDVGGSVPGLPGLFIAGIFAAALSTMSSSLNTLSGTIYEDFVKNQYVIYNALAQIALVNYFLVFQKLLMKNPVT